MRKRQLFYGVTGPVGLWLHEEVAIARDPMRLFLADSARHLGQNIKKYGFKIGRYVITSPNILLT
jgi:hypothetical protein